MIYSPYPVFVALHTTLDGYKRASRECDSGCGFEDRPRKKIRLFSAASKRPRLDFVCKSCGEHFRTCRNPVLCPHCGAGIRSISGDAK